MSLTATSTTTHVFDSNATTSVTFTPSANSLVVFYAVGDANDASTDEALTLTSTGHTLTRVQRANNGSGATVEIWYTAVTTSASMTVNVTDNKGSVPKFIKVVWFTDSGGSIPQIGRSDGRMDTYDTTNLSLLTSAAGSQIWGFGYAGHNFSAVTGQTLVDNLDTSSGFAGGDAIGLYSVTATSSGANQVMSVSNIIGANIPFHFAAVEITVPGVTQSGLFIRNVCSVSDNGNSTATNPHQTTLTIITPTNTQVGDLLVIIHCNDFWALSSMPTPTVTPTATVTAVANGTADAGSSAGHIKSYAAVVATAGEQIVSVTETSTADEEKALIVYVLSGANTTTPVDIASNAASASNVAFTQPVPSVTTTASNDMLIGHVNSGAGVGVADYAVPSGMAQTYNTNVMGFMGMAGGYQQLSAAGATGTQNFTIGGNSPYTGVIIAIKAAAASGNSGGTTAWWTA